MGKRKKKQKEAKVIPGLTSEATLKRNIRGHLKKLGFTKDDKGELVAPMDTKDSIRLLHAMQRHDRLVQHKDFVAEQWPLLKKHLADGTDVSPAKVLPRLELVEASTWQSDLFRLVSLSWSVPVSMGFGRRLRYLVWDDTNGKLVGIMALGDPVFNLRTRDDSVGWTLKQRTNRLVNVLDAYVVGAVPPYSFLLGGKLIASLIRTRNIRDDFRKKYADTKGIISKKRKKAQLVLVTTSSSLGRSSMYNRVALDGVKYLKPIGYTGGWGHFHIPDELFLKLRTYLRHHKHDYVDGHKFGDGPNWRLRTIRAAFDMLGFGADLLRHGIKREVYACELATNAREVLRGEKKRAYCRGLKTVSEVGELACQRWLVPRAARYPDYVKWEKDNFETLLKPQVVLQHGVENLGSANTNKSVAGGVCTARGKSAAGK